MKLTKVPPLNGNPHWKRLKVLARQLRQTRITTLFKTKGRFRAFSQHLEGLTLDFSKNLINDTVWLELLQLAKSAKVAEFKAAAFNGEAINFTEQRAVSHMALRAGSEAPAAVKKTLKALESLVNAVHQGHFKGFSGQPISDVVHIGIGGSHLGPELVTTALSDGTERIKAHFISNVDPNNLHAVLSKLTPATTLIVIASKTFTTTETMINARAALKWLVAGLNERNVRLAFNQVIAVTANEAKAKEFGVEHVLSFLDSVGGRFSLWSTIGVTIALSLGFKTFKQLLAGAHAMDEHFRSAPLDSNLPITLALIEIWRHNFLDTSSLAVIPYNYKLKLLPSFLQQLEMESNGKTVNWQGKKVRYATSPVVWGACGTDSQHSFHQLLMQGNAKVSVDLIVTQQGALSAASEQQKMLVLNALAQSKALMEGRSLNQLKADKALAPYKVIGGNVSHNLIWLPKLDAYYLGMLLALYEHKVMVLGCIWQVNSFDQWGVELGKQIAKQLNLTETSTGLDESTRFWLQQMM